MKDFRFGCLCLAVAAMMALFAFPTRRQDSEQYNLTAIVDITRSMNAEDYRIGDQPVSRLTFVKYRLRELAGQLPCGSRLGLGIFTERRSTLLYRPIEVCAGYNELQHSIAALDWRMAWAADSRIANGLLNAMELLQAQDSAMMFISDGQEAPPLNPRYRTDFSAIKGQLKGLILGSGGLQAVPIPKFDAKGQRTGVYGPDDVPHRSSFGESDLNPEKIEGYDARNAPFGKHAASGSEHLSAMQEAYLQQLAAESGLSYRRLQQDSPLLDIVRDAKLFESAIADTDQRHLFALLALAALLLSRL